MKKNIFLFWLAVLFASVSLSVLCSNQLDLSRGVGLFAHGFIDNETQAEQYRNGFVPFPLHAFNFPEAENRGFSFSKSSLGQQSDMDALKRQYDLLAQTAQEIYLVGLSRGAATILSLLGTQDLKKVKFVIVESPYDCFESVVKSILSKRAYIGWIPGVIWFANFLLPYVFGRFQADGIRPIDVVANIPKNIPILFVCSVKDRSVPKESVKRLYKKLYDAGHKHVYLLVLNEGEHSKLVKSDDAGRYRDVLHAFCKRYGGPFDTEAAQRGQQELNACQQDFSATEPAVSICQ